MKTEIFAACDQIVTAALNGVCQGAAVTVLVWLGLRVLGRTNAATRHALWLATLVLVLALIPVHLLRDRLASDARRFGGDAAEPHELQPAIQDTEWNVWSQPELNSSSVLNATDFHSGEFFTPAPLVSRLETETVRIPDGVEESSTAREAFRSAGKSRTFDGLAGGGLRVGAHGRNKGEQGRKPTRGTGVWHGTATP